MSDLACVAVDVVDPAYAVHEASARKKGVTSSLLRSLTPMNTAPCLAAGALRDT